MNSIELDKLKFLTEKYWRNTSPYISYPPLTEYKDFNTNTSYVDLISENRSQEFSIYIHIPFCESFCYFCACRTIITSNKELADVYISHLIKEMKKKAFLFDGTIVNKIHLGGGTPNFLTAKQLDFLLSEVHTLFKIGKDIEKVIEIDPNFVSQDQIDVLKKFQFNRASLGFQDGNKHVQTAINRFVSEVQLKKVVENLYMSGFTSVNIDLVYGLPMQSKHDFLNSVAIAHSSGANRIWMVRYIHNPEMFRGQKKIKQPVLASPFETNCMYIDAYEYLTSKKFRCFGMEYFVNETENWIPSSPKKIYRNITGFSETEVGLLGLGLFSVSEFQGGFFKNSNSIKKYYEDIEENHFFEKMYISNQDDVIRRYIIRDIQIGHEVIFSDVECKFHINFQDYFSREIEFLIDMKNDGLIEMDSKKIKINYHHYPFLRVLCKLFDNISNY